MIVNVRLNISEPERNNLKQFLVNHKTKSLATRKDVHDFVNAHIQTAIKIGGTTCTPLSENEWDTLKKRLLEDGKSDSFINGIKQVFDRVRE